MVALAEGHKGEVEELVGLMKSSMAEEDLRREAWKAVMMNGGSLRHLSMDELMMLVTCVVLSFVGLALAGAVLCTEVGNEQRPKSMQADDISACVALVWTAFVMGWIALPLLFLWGLLQGRYRERVREMLEKKEPTAPAPARAEAGAVSP